MQAILGPSGAGKSTLMDILALRGGAGRLCSDGGCVLVDGRPRAAADFLARSAYVPQVRPAAAALLRQPGLVIISLLAWAARRLRQPDARRRRLLTSRAAGLDTPATCTCTLPCHPAPPQAENFVPTMTAREALAFHAEVLLGRAGRDRRERAARVEEVLRVMGLAGAAGTLVGGPLPGGLTLRGLSGACAAASRGGRAAACDDGLAISAQHAPSIDR
jgi:hypothetical protein